MAKDKQPKAKGVPNKHLHARSTFLYQAATYLTLRAGESDQHKADRVPQSHPGLALQLGSDLQIVSRKGQVRLTSELKRTICKTCNTVLIPGRTATQAIENESKGGKKSWADVLTITCGLCGNKKRFPVGSMRQRKKANRHSDQTRTDLSGKSTDAQATIVSPIQTTNDQASNTA